MGYICFYFLFNNQDDLTGKNVKINQLLRNKNDFVSQFQKKMYEYKDYKEKKDIDKITFFIDLLKKNKDDIKTFLIELLS